MAVKEVSKARQEAATMTGNEAIALGMKQINPDVVAAYPITPSTDVVQNFASYVADGEVSSEFVAVESEHSAMSATLGASLAGARAMTSTSSQGLALMWEMLYITASMRAPVVAAVVNRALSGPINIHCDHSDTMGARDAGWIQLYSENAQEAYDNLLQAVRIAEHPDVRLPVMVCLDGFVISHAMENLQILDDRDVADFVGPHQSVQALLDVDKPVTYGPLALPDYYFEFRRSQNGAMQRAVKVIEEIGREYGRLTGREYGPFEAYHLDDAEYVVVVLNSAAGTAKDVAEELRGEGVRAGVLKLRSFRPLPADQLVAALKGKKAVAVLDRADSLNAVNGPVFAEVRSVMYDEATHGSAPQMVNYIYGLGGRDLSVQDLRRVYADLAEVAKTGRAPRVATYLGIRE